MPLFFVVIADVTTTARMQTATKLIVGFYDVIDISTRVAKYMQTKIISQFVLNKHSDYYYLSSLFGILLSAEVM